MITLRKGRARTARDPFTPFIRAGVKPGLERMGRLLEELGHPESRFRSVLVAGTNGKGTTAAVLASCLQALGQRVGLFTSPHLESVRERVRIDGRAVTLARMDAFLQAHGELCQRIGATYFEVTTACALSTFARAGVDWAVLEIGLGGRWDACNCTEPDVSVITSISRDHTEYLGRTLRAIASEKAQVARPGRPIVIGDVPSTARRALASECRRIGARPCWFRRDFFVRGQELGTGGGRFEYLDASGSLRLRTSMLGNCATVNAALAVCACRTLMAEGLLSNPGGNGTRGLAEGVRRATWPGRLQVISRRPLCVLDVAHNVASMEALVRDWRQLWPGSRPIVVMALLGDKEIGPIIRTLKGIAEYAIVTSALSPRSVPPARLAREWALCSVEVETATDIRSALKSAVTRAGRLGSVLICGSHFLVGPAMTALSVSAAGVESVSAVSTNLFRDG